MAKGLVVFFSRTGSTQLLAHQVADAGRWECEAIVDRKNRRGILGYLRSAFEATFARPVDIDAPAHRLSDYEVVIIGTPTWNQSVASPVRAFLSRHHDELARVALFVTCGGSGANRVLAQMTTLAGRAPVATLIVKERDLRTRPLASVDEFIATIEQAVAGPEARLPPRAPSFVPAEPRQEPR